MRPLGVVSVCVLLGALTPAFAGAAPPPPSNVDDARTHYRLGVRLYAEKRYEEALVELERANSLAPTYRLLYNIALVQEQLGDAAGALRSFGSYLDAGAEVPPARRAEVERAMASLSARVATLIVTSNVPGAEIVIDDRVAGTTPLAPVRLNPGPHHLGASKAGYGPETKAIDVVGGDHVEIPFSLQELPPPPVPEPPPPPPPPPAPEVVLPPPVAPPAPAPVPPPSEGRRRPMWIGWTATGALAAGAAATGIAALAASHTLSSDVDDHATSAGTIHAAHANTVALAAVSDVLTGAAVVAAGVTLYLTVARPSPVARVDLRAGPGALWLSGTF